MTLGFLKRLVHCLVKGRHDVARCAALDGESNVVLHDKLGKTLLDNRRHVLETSHAVRRGHAKGAKPPAFHEVAYRDRREKIEMVGAIQ